MDSNQVIVRDADGEFGGLSNRSLALPVCVNDGRLPTAEHLFHVLKFSHPMIQRVLVGLREPASCRSFAVSRDLRSGIREDWDDVKLEIMNFCVRTKLLTNWVQFGKLLHSTADKEILMVSGSDKYWGVVELKGQFVGENHLGILLMKLRDEFLGEGNKQLRIVTPPKDLDLRYLGKTIEVKDRRAQIAQLESRMAEANLLAA
jgi:ribA/ribD-fused uncharacterized protein